MKLSQAKEYLPFVQAAAEGKTVERKSHSGIWYPADCVDFSGPTECYRVANSPKLRAWKPGEAIGKIVHAEFWSEGIFAQIIAVDSDSVRVPCGNSGDNVVSLRELLEKYTQLDGTPCGVMES